jgi:biotin carboxyl carrier protein
MVAAGDILIVLEAMKMQNDLKSPMAGKVVRVHVSDGTNVEATTVMLEIEPAS